MNAGTHCTSQDTLFYTSDYFWLLSFGLGGGGNSWTRVWLMWLMMTSLWYPVHSFLKGNWVVAGDPLQLVHLIVLVTADKWVLSYHIGSGLQWYHSTERVAMVPLHHVPLYWHKPVIMPTSAHYGSFGTRCYLTTLIWAQSLYAGVGKESRVLPELFHLYFVITSHKMSAYLKLKSLVVSFISGIHRHCTVADVLYKLCSKL